MEFLRPALLWGLLGIALPVLIHLLGRRQVRTVPFATIRFLERARARAAAHLRLRRVLLLLARAAAMGGLAVAYAGPGCRQAAGPQGPQSVILILDTSPSMAASAGGRSPLEEGRRVLLAALDGARPDDRFLYATTWHGGEAAWRAGFTDDPASVRRAIREARVEFGRHDPGRAVENAFALVEGIRGGQVILATDLQASAWPDSPPGQPLAGPLRLADVGLAERSNAWVESAEEGDGSVRVVLGATGEAGGARRTVQLAVGGRPVLNAFVEDGETSFRFDPPAGSYEAEVRVSPGGALALDDRLPLAGRGSSLTRVLLVNGDPWGFEIRDELLFVRRALAPGTRLANLFRTREIRLGDLSPSELAGADVVVLANPGPVAPELASTLAARLEAGLGVIVTAGDRWGLREAGKGLGAALAAPIRDVVAIPPDDPSRRPYEGIDVGVLGGPLEPFRDRGLGDLSGVRVSRYWLPELRGGEPVAVWMRLENGAPLLVERRVGKGRTFLLGTTVDRDSSDLCLQPAFLPWLERLLLHAAGRLRPALDRWALAGEAFPLPYAEAVVVEGPGGRSLWQPGGPDFVPGEPGVYRIVSEGETVDAFAARIDPAESDLRSLSPAQAEALLGPAASAGEGGSWTGGRRDASTRFAGLILAALVLEALLSARWGWGRRRAVLGEGGAG